jgi:hypothetical protein
MLSMSESEISNPLPHNAKGLDLGDIVIMFCPDKVLVTPKTAGDHFTLHFGYESGVIDVHRTCKDGQHKTIFAMRRDSIPALLAELQSLLPAVGRLIRPLRLGWLVRQRIGIAWGVFPTEEEHISRVTRRQKRRLVLDQERFLSEIYAPDYDEVWSQPDGQFSLWKNGQAIGMAFKSTDPCGNARLAWIKLRDLNHLSDQAWRLMREAALRYAIPKSEYHNYPFLQLDPTGGPELA